MKRVESVQVAQIVSGMIAGAILLLSFGGWPAALCLGMPLGFMAGLAAALSYC